MIQYKESDQLVVGILAHVDSGKTTLAESMLYQSGNIRKLGRVDHKDAFLDTYELERSRGITIFAKQAQMNLETRNITLLDTPGHVDFSAEMERTLQVLDYAILVISGSDGVQGHTQTLWRLLKRYEIPVFLFINKMDQEDTDQKKLLASIHKQLDANCVDFSNCFAENPQGFYEELAMCDEVLMEQYIEMQHLEKEKIQEAICDRIIFPCFFGSALKQLGINAFLRALAEYTLCPCYPEQFGARIFKISRDEQGNRLTYLKITGGTLKVKMTLTNQQNDADKETCWYEKVDQIRIYSGNQYSVVPEASAGVVCAVTGLSQTYAGEGIGIETQPEIPVLEPVLTYQIILPPECHTHDMYRKLRILEEEEPQLHLVWNETLGEIHAQVMGEVQIEILKSLIQERFQISVEFGAGNIVYKETITEPVIGIGHFEPLRHYAEVHLLLEPLERGSGIEFKTECSEDVLDKNWQRLILTHLEEKKHKGVLIGAEITDLRITLITGRAHLKHTEGGDFRQATYRAVRQGLKCSNSILLEPIYEFRIEVPQNLIGRVMTDIQKRQGNFEPPVIEGELAILTGTAPVSTMQDYSMEVIAFSHGHGKIFYTLKGYEECHNTQEVLENNYYDSENDLQDPTGSVFCSHGAGYLVPWNEVAQHAHVENPYLQQKKQTDISSFPDEERLTKRSLSSHGDIAQEEIDEIFERTYGSAKQKRRQWKKTISNVDSVSYNTPKRPRITDQQEYLLVDGYNIIFSWDELRDLAAININSARDQLMDIMCNYQGVKKNILILVFDAYKVAGGLGNIFQYHNIHVVYTKEAETADQYIEKTTHDLASKHKVTVATSDGLEQMIIWGQGANRLSARGLKEDVDAVMQEIRTNIAEKNSKEKHYLGDYISEDIRTILGESNT